MSDILEYKGYIGSIEADVKSGVLHGTVHGIKDVVHYEAKDLPGLEAAFRESVDDYLAMCDEAGEQPERPYSGKFQARMSAELHQKVAAVAAARGISLNELLCRAVEREVA